MKILNTALYCSTFIFLIIVVHKLYNLPSSPFQTMTPTKVEDYEKPIFPDFIQMRLEESNTNWQRALKARKKLEILKLNDRDPWSYNSGLSIWDFFYPSYDCPHTVERIGKTGDGGKWVCGLNHLAKKKDPCIVYSYGVNYDTSFEDVLVSRTGCSIYLFDHTIDITKVTLVKNNRERVFIEKIGLGVNDNAPLRSIITTMKKYKHNFIDILKIDVEGAEFAVFDNIAKDFPNGIPVGQLLIEIHLPIYKIDFFATYKKWLTNLETIGFRPFRNEFNLYSLTKSPSQKYHPSLCEYSYINVQFDNFLLHSS